MNASKKKILEAAAELFSQKGFAAVTTKELAAEAHISEVTLFRHFSSKRDIFSSIMELMIRYPSLEYMGPESFIGQWHTDMSRFTGIIRQFYQENRRIILMLWKDSERNINDLPEISDFLQMLEHRVIAYIQRYWLMDKPDEAEPLARSYMSALTGILLNKNICQLLPPGKTIQEDTDILTQAYYELLTNRNEWINTQGSA